jgi:hypothetical protein
LKNVLTARFTPDRAILSRRMYPLRLRSSSSPTQLRLLRPLLSPAEDSAVRRAFPRTGNPSSAEVLPPCVHRLLWKVQAGGAKSPSGGRLRRAAAPMAKVAADLGAGVSSSPPDSLRTKATICWCCRFVSKRAVSVLHLLEYALPFHHGLAWDAALQNADPHGPVALSWDSLAPSFQSLMNSVLFTCSHFSVIIPYKHVRFRQTLK